MPAQSESKIPEIVEDRYFVRHKVEKVLGAGGQGMVAATDTPNIAAKLVLDDNGNPLTREASPESFKHIQSRFENIELMPLPDGVHVALPLALLSSHAGYVMRIMDDMQPLSELDSTESSPDDLSKYPQWIVGENPETQDVQKQHRQLYAYMKNGGLRRRLEILSRCAAVLAELHASGLVYGDLSPNNIFITADPSYPHPNVWLIDSDNVSLASVDNTNGSGVYTPKYGAPEIVQTTGRCSQDSDVYSFAIIAFETLSLVHPFWGKRLEGEDDGGDNWDDSVSDGSLENAEDLAMAGKLPWIDSQDDDSNSTENGLPRMLVLSAELQRCMDIMFTDGRGDQKKRIPILVWPELLAKAADTTVGCPDCGMSWPIALSLEQCPFCQRSAADYLVMKESGNVCFSREVLYGSEIEIPHRVFFPFDMRLHGVPSLLLTIEKDSSGKTITLKRTETSNDASITYEAAIYGKAERFENAIRIDVDDRGADNLQLLVKKSDVLLRKISIQVQEAL